MPGLGSVRCYLRVVAGVAIARSVELPTVSALTALVGSEVVDAVVFAADKVACAIGVRLAVAVSVQALALAAVLVDGMVHIAGLPAHHTTSALTSD